MHTHFLITFRRNGRYSPLYLTREPLGELVRLNCANRKLRPARREKMLRFLRDGTLLGNVTHCSSWLATRRGFVLSLINHDLDTAAHCEKL